MIQFFLFKNQYYLSQGFRAIFLRIFCEIAVRFFKKRFYYRAIIARQKSCEKLANRRAASDEKPTPVVLDAIRLVTVALEHYNNIIFHKRHYGALTAE